MLVASEIGILKRRLACPISLRWLANATQCAEVPDNQQWFGDAHLLPEGGPGQKCQELPGAVFPFNWIGSVCESGQDNWHGDRRWENKGSD